ncbi:MAG: hypothetical protein ACT4NX_01780 [Deltaproteobacteria bacterium]
MTSALIILGFIACMALLFWLDRAGERDVVASDREGFSEILDFISAVDWNIASAELIGNLREPNVIERRQGELSVSCNLSIQGFDVLASYYFEGDGLARISAEMGHFSQADFDSLFRAAYRRYGTPRTMSGEDEHGGALVWNLPDGSALALEETSRGRASVSVSRDR